MPPALTETPAPASHLLSTNTTALKSIFPDGIKTSGQHPPLYDQLKLYSSFPKEITGPTVWKAEDYIDNPERWTHPFSEDEIAEISQTADKFLADAMPLTGISKNNFPLPNFSRFL